MEEDRRDEVKVLHINSYFGKSDFYKNLYDTQIEYGVNIDVFVPVPFSSVTHELNLGDYTTISANHGKYDRFIFHLKHNKIYKDILLKYNIQEYSIIHAHSLFSNGFIAMKLKKEFGIPYIVAVRNTDVHTFFKSMPHLRSIGVKILAGAEKVIFLSEAYKETVIKKYIPNTKKSAILMKSIVIPNGIDNFWFENQGDAKGNLSNYKLNLVYAGVVNKNKNLLTMSKAIEILQKKGYKVQFTIVGRISDESIYNQLKSLSFVKYIEPMPKEDLIKIYRLNDIFVMPSIHETFGLVYPEAMSQGLPVIYTKGQGFDGHFNEGLVGYGVDCYKPEDIAGKIIRIVNNYKSISNSSVANVGKFKWGKITHEYLKVYTDIARYEKNESEKS